MNQYIIVPHRYCRFVTDWGAFSVQIPPDVVQQRPATAHVPLDTVKTP
jgi:hypothetical protein